MLRSYKLRRAGAIFELIKLVFQAIKVGNTYINKRDYYNALFLEYLDNGLQAMQQLDWGVIILKGIDSHNSFMEYLFIELPEEAFEKLSGLNHTETGYYSGYTIFTILEFILPPLKIAKISKAGKLEKAVIEFFDNIVPERAGRKSSANAAELFFDTVENFIKILEQGTEGVTKFIDDIYLALRKWADETLGIGKRVDISNYNELYKQYGKLVGRGSYSIKYKFTKETKNITKYLKSKGYEIKVKNDYVKYKTKSKAKKILKETEYIEKHRVLTKNNKIGKLAEEIVEKLLGGKIDPKKSIKIAPDKLRYPDNFLKGTMGEIKSGKVTMKYKDQIDKDITLLMPPPKKFQNEFIKKMEWHCIDGIDEVVLKYIRDELELRKISIDKFQVILY